MQIIPCINWAAFSCWLVWAQLYYVSEPDSDQTMLRILSMFFWGVVTTIIVALIIGRIEVVYIVGALFVSARPDCFTHPALYFFSCVALS